MKKQDYSLTLIYGVVGAILFLVGVAFLFLGAPIALIFGLIFMVSGGILAYLGIKAIPKVKRQIAEQKLVVEKAKIEKENAIKNNLCPKCGESTTAEDAFCRKCGFKLK